MGWAIPFFSGMIIGKFWEAIIAWFVLAILFFGYIEALLLCRHCPHYAEKGYNLSCPINRVPDDVKDSFFRHCPEFRKAWDKTESDRI